jgi:hypothetical protein
MIETDAGVAGYEAGAAATLHGELLRRIAALPGVEAAALSYGLPMANATAPIVVEGAGTDAPASASMIWAGPGFFDAMRVPLLRGRVFDERDVPGAPRAAVLSEAMARRHFGTVDAVGRRFRRAGEPDGWSEVIGVVGDTAPASASVGGVPGRFPDEFYLAYAQAGRVPTTLLARTSGDAGELLMAMRREADTVDPMLPVVTAQTMARAMARDQAAPRAVASALGLLAGLGLLMAGIGLYAVVAFAVARRTREIGIRLALGARRTQVMWSMARGVAGLVGIGTGIGLGLSVLLMLTMRAASSGSASLGIGNIDVYRPSVDPMALLAIAALTAVVGAAATLGPARRATRLDPLAALRHD